MSRSLRARVTVVVAAAAGLLVSASGVAASAPEPSPSSIAENAIGALEEYVNTDQDQFGGVSVEAAGRAVTVTVPPGASAGDARAKVSRFIRQYRPTEPAAGGSWRLSFRSVERSLRQLNQVMGRVQRAEPWASAAGKAVTEYSVDEARNVVNIGVERVTPAATQLARRTFGDAVVLHQAPRAHLGFSRLDDWPAPHWGGSRIATSIGSCSTGFVIHNDFGNEGSLTAAHCVRNAGEIVRNNGQGYGNVILRVLSQNGSDSAVIQHSSEGRVYVSSPTSSANRPVKGSSVRNVGNSVCVSGSFTGENCAGKVAETNLCVPFTDGITRCNLNRAASTNNTNLAQSGDSGGPVYIRDANGDVRAVGMFIGGSGTSPWKTVYYHPVGHLLTLHGMTLVTS